MYNFHPWYFQEGIPKLYSEYETLIPGNFVYHIKLSGGRDFTKHESNIERGCIYVNGIGNGDCTHDIYIMKDIPAFKEEDYMTSADNFKFRLDFELKEYQRFRRTVEKYTKTWKDVDKELKNEESLGVQSKKDNYFRKQLPPYLFEIENNVDRAKTIYSYLKEHLYWNEKYDLFGKKDVKEAFEKKTGSIAELNLILLNALKAANLEAEILLLSTRQNGIPTKLYPVLSDFNYLVVKLNIEGSVYLLDISEKELNFGLLPFRCLNGEERVFNFEDPSYWYPIIPVKNSMRSFQTQIRLDSTAAITGKSREIKNGYEAYFHRKQFANSSLEDYRENIENNLLINKDILIGEVAVQNLKDYDNPIVTTTDFNIESPLSADVLFVYPFIFNQFKRNPFSLAERNYPIDFGYPFSITNQVIIEIPEGFEFTDIPDSQQIKDENNQFELYFVTQKTANKLSLIIRLKLLNTIYIPAYYQLIKDLFKEFIRIQNKSPLAISKK